MYAHRMAALLVLTLALATASDALAQNKCVVGDTVEKCWERHQPTASEVRTMAEVVKETSAADVDSRLKSFETGLGGGVAELATTTRNFLPFLVMSGLIADSDGDANDQLFTLDLNFLLGDFAKDRNTQLKAILNTDPKLFEPLKTAFDTATGSTDRSAALEEDLTASDDYTVSFTYSHINKKVGRSFKQYSASVLQPLRGRHLGRHRQRRSGRAKSRSDDPCASEAEPGDRAAARQRYRAAGPGDARTLRECRTHGRPLEARVREAMTVNKLPRFAELVNNQPQLTVTAELHERDAFAGAKESAIKIAYEFGLANVSRFESASGGVCELFDGEARDFSSEAATKCLTSFRSYIESNEQRLKNADRFSFELSYVEVDDYAFSSPTDGVSLVRDGTKRIDVSAGYGRTMQVVGTDQEGRLDIVAKYEDYSDDPDHRDRLVATITLTTEINGISLPLALVYANHGRFLPETDEQLSAHIGIKYQLDPKKD